MSSIEIDIGTDVTFNLTVTQGGSAKDLSDVVAIEYQLAKNKRSANPYITKSLGSGITVTDPVNGKIQIVLTAAETSLLQDGLAYQECRVTDVFNKSASVHSESVTIKNRRIRN